MVHGILNRKKIWDSENPFIQWFSHMFSPYETRLQRGFSPCEKWMEMDKIGEIYGNLGLQKPSETRKFPLFKPIRNPAPCSTRPTGRGFAGFAGFAGGMATHRGVQQLSVPFLRWKMACLDVKMSENV